MESAKSSAPIGILPANGAMYNTFGDLSSLNENIPLASGSFESTNKISDISEDIASMNRGSNAEIYETTSSSVANPYSTSSESRGRNRIVLENGMTNQGSSD